MLNALGFDIHYLLFYGNYSFNLGKQIELFNTFLQQFHASDEKTIYIF